MPQKKESQSILYLFFNQKNSDLLTIIDLGQSGIGFYEGTPSNLSLIFSLSPKGISPSLWDPPCAFGGTKFCTPDELVAPFYLPTLSTLAFDETIGDYFGIVNYHHYQTGASSSNFPMDIFRLNASSLDKKKIALPLQDGTLPLFFSDMNHKTIYAFAPDSVNLWEWNDSDGSWNKISFAGLPSGRKIAAFAYDSKNKILFAGDDSGGILTSSDFLTWKSWGTGSLRTGNTKELFFDPDKNLLIAVTTAAEIYSSMNGGAWTLLLDAKSMGTNIRISDISHLTYHPVEKRFYGVISYQNTNKTPASNNQSLASFLLVP